jgi:hypothetical protein
MLRLLYEPMNNRYYLYYPDYKLVWGKNGNQYWDDYSINVVIDKYSKDISTNEFPDNLKKKVLTSMFESEIGVFSR